MPFSKACVRLWLSQGASGCELVVVIEEKEHQSSLSEKGHSFILQITLERCPYPLLYLDNFTLGVCLYWK